MAETTLAEAAALIAHLDDNPGDARVVEEIDIKGAQARYLSGGELVVAGSNEFSDWYDFNLDIFGVGLAETHGFEVIPGDSGALYHGGFLEHAQILYPFAKALRPRIVMGHSLGAAAAQILGSSLGVRAVGFGGPRVLKSAMPIRGAGWVTNVCRRDDPICYLPPPFLGFRHVGRVLWLPGDLDADIEDHLIGNYIAALAALPPGIA